MTLKSPKDKALELLCKYEAVTCPNWEQGNNKYTKQCALIAVDEIIDNYVVIPEMRRRAIEYWQEVKKELELL